MLKLPGGVLRLLLGPTELLLLLKESLLLYIESLLLIMETLLLFTGGFTASTVVAEDLVREVAFIRKFGFRNS